MITLTEGAKAHLNNLKEKHKVDYVRLDVKGGGCAGHEYEWSFIPNEFEKTPTKDIHKLIEAIFHLRNHFKNINKHLSLGTTNDGD